MGIQNKSYLYRRRRALRFCKARTYSGMQEYAEFNAERNEKLNDQRMLAWCCFFELRAPAVSMETDYPIKGRSKIRNPMKLERATCKV